MSRGFLFRDRDYRELQLATDCFSNLPEVYSLFRYCVERTALGAMFESQPEYPSRIQPMD